MAYQRRKIVTAEQVERAFKMREPSGAGQQRKLAWRKVAKAIGVSERALMAHVEPSTIERARAQKRVSLSRNLISLNLGLSSGEKLSIPEHVLEERDRRLSIVPSPAAALLGDPPPGYSALDRKRAQASAGV